MKTYKVTITRMSDHITDLSHKNQDFFDLNRAAAYFNDLNYYYVHDDYVDVSEEMTAGGNGFDYRVELVTVNE